MSDTLRIAQVLIRQPSVTPDDQGCQDLIVEQLLTDGFTPQFMNFGAVRNLWLRRGTQRPLFVFAGHTDVVPTGPEERWVNPPFSGEVIDGMLHGRGAADMKGSLA
ncbi:MAG TPA: succinyl-diaminopimelate desuccinylase, partial [Gammaproteobacteria bacterium]|nr:succinyl-diaminopimelate desuccinylase [Gammaproteobacteria bacterium]